MASQLREFEAPIPAAANVANQREAILAATPTPPPPGQGDMAGGAPPPPPPPPPPLPGGPGQPNKMPNGVPQGLKPPLDSISLASNASSATVSSGSTLKSEETKPVKDERSDLLAAIRTGILH